MLLSYFILLLPPYLVTGLPATQRGFATVDFGAVVSAPPSGTWGARTDGEGLGEPVRDAAETNWNDEEGVGHFSDWSRASKLEFLEDLRNNRAGDWTLVMGNE